MFDEQLLGIIATGIPMAGATALRRQAGVGRRRARRQLQSPYGFPAFPPHMLFSDDSVFN